MVGWADLLNRILAATTSGQGPDVFNIGNTWSPTLQATGALLPFDDANMAAIGGKDRFLAGSLSATGAAGKAPTAVPIYSLAYALYYNKKEFAAAGIASPPATWDDLVTDGQKLTHGGQWGLALEAGSVTESIHHAFTIGQQYGGDFFDASGKPTFDAPGNADAIKRYIDFMGDRQDRQPERRRVLDEPVDHRLRDRQGRHDHVAGRGRLDPVARHEPASDYGVAPIPFEAPVPAGGKHVNSMVAGINLAVMANTKHKAAALQFVKFMTSDAEQVILNKTYSSLPTVQGAYSDAAFQTPTVKTFQQILSSTAAAAARGAGRVASSRRWSAA